jgi:FkbM family methyltransferase
MNPDFQTKVKDFKQLVLKAFYLDMQNTVADNYDYERFSYDGVDRSKIFSSEVHSFYLDWFITNASEIYKTFAYLGDVESRMLYIDLLRFRLSGHLHTKITSSISALIPKAQAFSTRFPGEASAQQAKGMFGNLFFYDFDWEDKHYTLDTIRNSLICTLVYGQYFFARNGITIMPEPGDHVIDGGACTGDTAIVFSKTVGETGRVYAFDPVQNHIDICKHNFARPGYENILLFESGLSDSWLLTSPIQLKSYAPGFNGAGMVFPLCTIDDLVADGSIQKIDFLKLDVEGAEMATLRGALSSIKKFKPKMAISIYHKPNDLFEICNFLFEQDLGYQFYIDHYTIHMEETVLYCKPI